MSMIEKKKKILIINGPNLNLLGKRETTIYGKQSFSEYLNYLKSSFSEFEVVYFQSNIEGEIIEKIHNEGDQVMGLVINAGAYSHTSIAIADAIRATGILTVEVHISNVFRREQYRHNSYISQASQGVIVGLGLTGYKLGINWIIHNGETR